MSLAPAHVTNSHTCSGLWVRRSASWFYSHPVHTDAPAASQDHVTDRGALRPPPSSLENTESSGSLDMVYHYYYYQQNHNSMSVRMCSLQMEFLFRSHSSCLKAKILELMSVFTDEKGKHRRVIGLRPSNGPGVLLSLGSARTCLACLCCGPGFKNILDVT